MSKLAQRALLGALIVLPLVVLLLALPAPDDEPAAATPTLGATSAPEQVAAGVILAGPPGASGWDDLAPDRAGYASAQIGAHRVLVFAGDASAESPVGIVSLMVERGARVIFIAPGAALDPGASRLETLYPRTVFVMNLAGRDDVARLLPALLGE